ncbi:MAG: hypothetical protein GF408_01410 [Candidatus Omnitrophica bacterium]|nr:hypothetical protein [Candidatus Omnitrophota bacterium]
MNKYKIDYRLVLLLVAVFLIASVAYYKLFARKPETGIQGFSGGQKSALQDYLSEASEQFALIKKGNELLSEGDIARAISEYERAFEKADTTVAKGEALFCLANAYEKDRNYTEALKHINMYKDNYVAEWAQGPVNERSKYLMSAAKGDYLGALLHAERSIAEYEAIYKGRKEIRPDYIERLNDLKASRAYIENLGK